MGKGAAFFDLDRTLLRKASGPVLTEALVSAGVAPDRNIPGVNLVYNINDVLGETLVGMGLARLAANVARGWAPEAVREAAAAAADRLAHEVVPYARPLLDEHRRAGRPVVLATTTPYDMVAPLAERLDIDDVVATRYAVADGAYTGGLEGEFVWGRGKLAAVRRWAEAQGVDLADSWAYSDSVFDVPLLSAVGHPCAVNPDLRLRAAAQALEGGQLVALMPQGTIPRGEAFFDPVLKGKWGAARLAAMTRAPVVPVGVWGTEKVWPRNARVPNIVNVLGAPHIRVRVGRPTGLAYADAPA